MSVTSLANSILTDAQLRIEMDRCEYCAEKPCKAACPCGCSPADFIMAAKLGAPSDFRRAAAEIMSMNPLGGVCGQVCPDRFCMAACSHRRVDGPLEIPAIQATIVAKARALGVMPLLQKAKANGKRVAVVGGGPAGLAAAALLGQHGYAAHVFETRDEPGGVCHLIPRHRLDRAMLQGDVAFIMSLGNVSRRKGRPGVDPAALLAKGYDAVVVAAGLWDPIVLPVRNSNRAIKGLGFLEDAAAVSVAGGRVAVIGGGATALDCAVTAKLRGAVSVEMFALEKIAEMPVTVRERAELLAHGIDVSGRTRVAAIRVEAGRIAGLDVMKVRLPEGEQFSPAAVRDVAGSEQVRRDIDHVIMAIGARPRMKPVAHTAVFHAGDMVNGPSTVVEAAAAGKNAALRVMAYLEGRRAPRTDQRKSAVRIPGYDFEPVSLQTDFFGRTLSSPFLLSASPASDGYEQMKRAYEAGWAGGIMKTAFDNLPIHIPAEYMTCFDESTWGNCDNVSEHPIDRVCREVRRLVKEHPDRLTGASTGGTVSGNDDADRASWQGNTRKLESAGAMVIEYSLSCPQGGEGAEGDIVSQNAALTARIIGWVMEVGRADIPKLFKLTSAVTDIKTILKAVKAVFERYPDKKAGVTLANTFPSLTFKPGSRRWEDGVVVGMSGQGITPVSYLCLATACGQAIEVSGNAGPVNYRAAANFLALGTNTVQFCTVVEKHGYGILHELRSGLSHLLAERGIRSIAELRGITQPNPIRGFMDLDADKRVSTCNRDLCVQCGNCTRCPYLAISLDADRYPVTDASKCIGCSLCALQCFTGAMLLRERLKA